MNFLNRFISRWAPAVSTFIERRSMPFSFTTWLQRRPVPPIVDWVSYCREGYANSLVYPCIRKIATTAPFATMRVEKLVNGLYEAVDHPLNDLLSNPHPGLTGFEFQEALHTYLNLAGECFIVKIGMGGKVGRPLKMPELWFARPDRISPVVKFRDLLGFVYTADSGEKTYFLPEEVLHVKYPNPNDPLEGFGRGLSPLNAAAREVGVDNSATLYMTDFFENACVPFGLLSSKHTMDQAEIDRVRENIRAQYTAKAHATGGGGLNSATWNGWTINGSASGMARAWHEIMIVDADLEYQELGKAPDKIALPDIRAFTESRVCSVFDVPPVLVGVQVGLKNAGGFSQTTIADARRQLWHDKIMPDNVRIAQALTSWFRDQLEPGFSIRHYYGDVAVLQEDRTARYARANTAYAGGWATMDEARLEAGLPRDPENGSKYKWQIVEGAGNVGADDVDQTNEVPNA